MYKVGDEVLIKAEVKDDDGHGKKQIKIKGIDGYSPLWIDVYELIPADKTYADGLNDAWELAKKIYDMKCDAIEEIFGVKGGFYDVIRNFTFEDCRDKIESYEKEKKIKVGDVVKVDGMPCVVTAIYKESVDVLFEDGACENSDKKRITKTGKHIDIESLLRQIGE